MGTARFPRRRREESRGILRIHDASDRALMFADFLLRGTRATRKRAAASVKLSFDSAN